MAIRYINEVNQEAVAKEKWRWVATLKDGTELRQFEVTAAGAVFKPFAALDHSQVRELRLEHDTLAPVSLFLPDGAKLIHFYFNSVLENGAIRLRWYVIGWEHNQQKVLLVIDDKNRVIMTNDHTKVRIER